MLFNSYEFIFAFLPFTLLGWWFLPRAGLRLIFLLGMSYVFYGAWDWRFVPLMLLSTTVDYLAGKNIAAASRPEFRKRWLAGALSFNLGILFFFKYASFSFSVFGAAARFLGSSIGPSPAWLSGIVLPVGISFYTFNSMSYTIDVYRRRVEPARNLLHFSTFVAVFPHLVAGPIVRYADIGDQFERLKTRLSAREAVLGVHFFVIGLSKKLLLADFLAPEVDRFFAYSRTPGFIEAWAGMLGYSFQLYFDFSGYCDMAVGLAYFLGLQFPLNFDSPYQARNISDFWRRWHISLSTWLRDYLYIPLGGAKARAARNLLITMFLGGLWHGAQWTFIFWGLFHGLLLVVYHGLKRRGPRPGAFLSVTLTFVSVVFGWVLFRSPTLSHSARVWRGMLGLFGFNGDWDWRLRIPYLSMLIFCGILAFACSNTWRIDPLSRRSWPLYLALLFVGCLLYLEHESPFLYFQF